MPLFLQTLKKKHVNGIFLWKKTIFEPPTYNIVIDFCNITAAVSGLHVTSQIATKKI